MRQPAGDWLLLFYTLPTQPSRLRLQIWRSLQKMGALYLHNGAWVLPALPELIENMEYTAASIQELGGSCQVILGTARLPGGEEQIVAEFRAMADERAQDTLRRLGDINERLDEAAGLSAIERAEEDIKRERTSYLRQRRIAYFGCNRDAEVDKRIAELRGKLDTLFRTAK
jgi:hypothetical protein